MKRIVIIARNSEARAAIKVHFSEYATKKFNNIEETQNKSYKSASNPVEFLFVEVDSLTSSGNGDVSSYRNALAPLRSKFPTAHLIVLSSAEQIRETVKAVKAGATNYLTYPIVPEEVGLIRESIEESVRARAEIDHLRDPFWEDDHELVRTRSFLMKEVYQKVRQVAETKSTVLLTGETGTGKNLLAKLIHRRSNRAEKQFIAVHCGAIAETLLESELFGHERGAFTGAVRRKLGKFEIANGGTIFLDELGTISPTMQIKLLEVLQDHSFQRVGGEQRIEVDVRILAATNTNLKEATQDGSFRKDLYFRINVFPIELPPLRLRREDLSSMVEIFLERMNKLYQKDIEEVHPLVMDVFHRYEWPGNVRELESLIERAYILESTSTLTPESFPQELFASADGIGQVTVDTAQSLAQVRQRAVENIERLYLKEQLSNNNGRINATAKAAGITERQLHKLMVKHGLKKEDFRSLPPKGKRLAAGVTLNRNRRKAPG